MSRVLPDAIIARAQQELGIADSKHLQEELPKMIAEGLQRLYDFQHTDGGWGWWKNDASNPFNTAYVLFGLEQIRRAGFPVEEERIDKAARYLRRWLTSTDVDTKPMYCHHEGKANSANTRAYALYVMAALGRGEPGLTGRLYEQRDKLDHYGRAYLALALWLLNDQTRDPHVDTLLEELADAAIVTDGLAHWEEKTQETWNMGTDVRSTAIILDALVRITPDDPLIPKVVRWLMLQRRPCPGQECVSWATTQETSNALIALVDYLIASGEMKADYTYRVLVDGIEVGRRVVNRRNLAVPGRFVVSLSELPPAAQHVVEIVREVGPGQSGQGSLYYSLSLRRYRPVEEARPSSRGLEVHRRYVPRGKVRPTHQARIGDVIEVHLEIKVGQPVNYLVVEDPLPAGLEPIDTSLQTTGRSYRTGQQKSEWVHIELRDEKVVLFATYLRPGTYTYTYLARATTAGTFHALPMQAYPMYDPDVWGRGSGDVFTVK